MKVLLIDHEADQIDAFHEELSHAGFEVRIANNGQMGFQEALTFLPDVILLGEMLPNMRGNDVLKMLKINESVKKIPVVILSHFHNEKLVSEAMDLGAADYIAKDTMSAPDLVEKIKAIIQQQHGGTGWQEGDANAL